MNNARINNEIDLTYPDGFKEMTEDDLKRHFGTAENRWGVFDAANHTILSVNWAKLKWYRKLCDTEWYLIDVEGRLKRQLLNYQRAASYKTKIASKKKNNACAIRFEYRADNSVNIHVGDLVVFKHKKKVYYIYYITRQPKAVELLPAFEEVLKSITLN